MALDISTRRIKLNKSKSIIFGVVIGATVVTIFSLFAFKALIDQGRYQNRVLDERKKVVKQLDENVKNAEKLVEKFKEFDQENPNFLGGERDGAPGTLNPGENPRLVLDSLPSKYDFPALATSIEKLMNSRAIVITGIKGVDDVENNPDDSKPQPEKVEMAFSVDGRSNYNQIKLLIGDFERSIRPFHLTNIEFSGKEDDMKVNITGLTYYQPSKSLDLETTKVVK